MTGTVSKKKTAKRQIGVSPRLSLSGGITLLFSALLLWYAIGAPQSGAAAARAGLRLCAESVIPSLFPFLVLSSLLVSSGISEPLGKRLTRPMRFLFGISGQGAIALILGAFCGFPVGARITSNLYERGVISKSEAERLLVLSNSPSFAFLFSAVGNGFFSDRRFGFLLYGAVLLSVLLSGILLRLLFGKCEACPPAAFRPSPKSTSELFVSSISGAGTTMLTICAFIVFFSVLSDALSALLSAVSAPPEYAFLLSGLLELSRGAKNAAETRHGLCGRVLCGLFAGWGGLCAHLQVIATAERPLPDRARKDRLSFRSYFILKFFQGLFTALLIWIASRIR